MAESPEQPLASEIAEARFAAVVARLGELRERTSALILRTEQATSHARTQRDVRRAGCNHAVEVASLRESLEAVERELEGLRTAMRTRAVIEQAKGMLMLERRCGADAAFDALVRLSQSSHRKLVDVAGALVEAWSTGGRVRAPA